MTLHESFFGRIMGTPEGGEVVVTEAEWDGMITHDECTDGMFAVLHRLWREKACEFKGRKLRLA